MSSKKNNSNTDYIDKEIIRKLGENGRMPFSDLAKELNISNSISSLFTSSCSLPEESNHSDIFFNRFLLLNGNTLM